MRIEVVTEQLLYSKEKKGKIHMHSHASFFKGLGKHNKKVSYFEKEILPSKIRQLWYNSWERVEVNSSPNP